MSDRFTVLIADFLDETSIESAVLDDIARIVIANAKDETELANYLPEADAILLFHAISILGEQSFSRTALPMRGPCRRRLQQRRPRGGHETRRDRVQCARLWHRGSRRPRDHASVSDRAPARPLA